MDSKQVPSWLERYWDDSYLCTRDAIPINVNYCFVFEDDPEPAKNNQVLLILFLLLLEPIPFMNDTLLTFSIH